MATGDWSTQADRHPSLRGAARIVVEVNFTPIMTGETSIGGSRSPRKRSAAEEASAVESRPSKPGSFACTFCHKNKVSQSVPMEAHGAAAQMRWQKTFLLALCETPSDVLLPRQEALGRCGRSAGEARRAHREIARARGKQGRGCFGSNPSHRWMDRAIPVTSSGRLCTAPSSRGSNALPPYRTGCVS